MAQYPVSQVMTNIDDQRRGQNTVNFVKTAGGVYLPQKGKDDGTAATADQEVLAQLQSLQQDTQAMKAKLNGTIDQRIVESNIMMPIDIQGHLQQTIQTHNSTTIAPSGWSEMSTWIDTAGFDRIAFSLLNDASTNTVAIVFWSHDANTKHAESNILTTSAVNRRSNSVETQARYCKFSVQNGDAAPHQVSAYVYLKA